MKLKEVNYRVTPDKIDTIKSKLKPDDSVTIIDKAALTSNKPSSSTNTSLTNNSTTNNDSVVNEEQSIKAGDLRKEKKVFKEKDLIKKISNLNNYLVKHKFYPELVDKSFIETILENRLNEIKKRLSKYDDLSNLSVDDLKNKALVLYKNCVEMEKSNKKQLEKLAKSIIFKQLELPEELINLNCCLVNNSKDISEKVKKEEKKDINIEFNNTEEINELKKEREKRYIVNALIEGFSKSYDYLYRMSEKELLDIEPRLIETYNKLLAINDYLYYVLDNDKNQNIKSGEYILNKNEKNVNIDVYSLTFPTLIYEAIKGIFESISLNMLPENERIKTYIHNNVDLKDNEYFNSLIGIPLWEVIEENIPKDKLNLKPYIFLELLKIKDNNLFEKYLKELFAKTKEGKNIINNIISNIENNFKDKEFEERINISKEKNKPKSEYLSNSNEIKNAF